MIGREFPRVKNDILLEKNGKLRWDRDGLNELYKILEEKYDPEIDEMPNVDPSYPK